MADLSVLALGVDLLAGLANPFANHRTRMRRLYVLIVVRASLVPAHVARCWRRT